MGTPRTFLVSAFVAICTALTAQNKIAVQHGSSVTFFDQTSLQAALDGAQNGDVVHLPGGTFTGPYTLNKSVQIIGAGYFPDSSAATTTTTITSSFYLTANASNSYISGINFVGGMYGATNTVPIISNLVVHRCQLQSGFGTSISSLLINNNSSNIIISECVASGDVYLNNAQNCIIRNCLFANGTLQMARNASVQSCIFLMNSINIVNTCANCVILGNIFYGVGASISGVSSSYSIVTKNCFVNPTPAFTYATGYGNVVGTSAAQLFAAYSSPYDYMDNFHLGPNSAALGTGPGGIDCGIYGGPSPWKPGGVPYNPHIQQQFIGTATDQQGNLPVQIKVGAQGQ